MNTTADRVKQIIADEADCNITQVTDEKHLEHDLRLDSLDRYELTMALEDEFGIEISDDEGAPCNTVTQIVALVERKVEARAV